MHFISFHSIRSFIHSFHVMSFRLNSFQSFYSFIYSFLPFFLSFVHSFHFISFPLISFQLTSFQITNNSCKQTCSYSCPIFEASARACAGYYLAYIYNIVDSYIIYHNIRLFLKITNRTISIKFNTMRKLGSSPINCKNVSILGNIVNSI